MKVKGKRDSKSRQRRRTKVSERELWIEQTFARRWGRENAAGAAAMNASMEDSRTTPALPSVNLTAMAAELGLSRKHVSEVVNGRARAGMKMLRAVREVFGLTGVEEAEEMLAKLTIKKGVR